jgi:hypothetical protein
MRSIISVDNEFRIKMHRIYIYNELLRNFRCNDRFTAQESQLWLID